METELKKYVVMMKKRHAGSATLVKTSDLESQHAKVEGIRQQIDAYINEVEAGLGLPPGFLDTLEERENPEPMRLWRTEQAATGIKISQYIEPGLVNAVEELRRYVPTKWLEDEKKNRRLLDDGYLKKPLSLVAGCRLESENQDIHRFAHALLAAEDFLTNRRGYDFHAGSLLLPELARLGNLLPALSRVQGSEERFDFLYKGPSKSYHSTIHELLVAGSCPSHGIDVEFLPARKGLRNMYGEDYHFVNCRNVYKYRRRFFILPSICV